MPFSTAEECVKGMFLTAGATKKQAEHKAAGCFRVCGAPKLNHLYPVSMFVSFTNGYMLTSVLCNLTPGCQSCWDLDRLMFSAQRSVAPLLPWWFSGLSWKSHTITLTLELKVETRLNTTSWTELCFKVFFEALNFVKLLNFCMVAVCVWICVQQRETMKALFLSREWV